ncbi:unnamed protein product [Allacma fusca]|uniref:Nucleolar protein 14 n=1 Tax=Allacma fusca TaxID=39272 RepID=A0A8J2P304_9HEXA|nr:unnamed protein product [Allacma fusca]
MNLKNFTDRESCWCASRSWAVTVGVIQIITSFMFVILHIRSFITVGAGASSAIGLVGWIIVAIMSVVLLIGVQKNDLFKIQLWLYFTIVSIPLSFVVNAIILFQHPDMLAFTTTMCFITFLGLLSARIVYTHWNEVKSLKSIIPEPTQGQFQQKGSYTREINEVEKVQEVQPGRSKTFWRCEVFWRWKVFWRLNKRKQDVLGRVQKYEKGMPGVSRGKANEIRRATLLKEYKQRNKSNVVLDRRIGEKNKAMPEEDKLIRRAAVEKTRQYKKKSIFSLGEEDELLTHKGKPLVNVDRYEDPREQSDSEDELLSEAFVGDANFGGGFLRVKPDQEIESEQEETEDGNVNRRKSRDEIIAELILASKKRKFEKAKESDENYEKIQDLDAEFKTVEFKNLLNQLQAPKKPPKGSLSAEELLAKIREENNMPSTNVIENAKTVAKSQENEKPDKIPEKVDYDRLVRELQFEKKKARPSDLPQLGVEQIQTDREDLLEQLKDTGLSEELKAKLEKILNGVFEAKGGDKTQLPDVLSGLIGFFLKNLQYYGNVNEEEPGQKISVFSNNFKDFCDVLIPPMYSLFVANTVGCTKRFLEHLTQAQEEFQKTKSRPLNLQSIALLHLCPKIFPTTESRHFVLTPASILLLEIIGEGKMSTAQSSFRILHSACILYEFVQESKRYVPEVITFLWSIVLCYCARTAQNSNLMAPNVRKARELLSALPSVLEESRVEYSDSDSQSDLTTPTETGSLFPEQFLTLVLSLLEKFILLYEYLPSSQEIFRPIAKSLKEMIVSSEVIKTSVEKLTGLIENLKGNKEFLRIAAEKPKPLRLYEPLIDEDFDGTRKRRLPRQKQEEARLAHKVKKEFKSAVREIKKDNAFLARQQLRDQMSLDTERKRKVKELLGSLANQEGDYQKLKRKKK